jgi:hypothetical protein
MKASWSINALVRRPVSCAALLLTFSSALLGAQQPPLSTRARDIRLTIETDRSIYHVGDSITVKVSLTNLSNSPVPVVPLPPWYIAHLIITTQGGRVVTPVRSPGAGSVDMQARRLKPHETVVWSWTGQEWSSLRLWGYELNQPGHYSIVGVPQVTGPAVEPDYKSVRSNRINITVVP